MEKSGVVFLMAWRIDVDFNGGKVTIFSGVEAFGRNMKFLGKPKNLPK